MTKLPVYAFAFFALIPSAFSATGFTCPKLDLKISKVLISENTSTLSIQHGNGSVEENPHLVLPEGNDTDSYQDRIGTYLEIQSNTQNFFPYSPEFLLVFRIMKSRSLYLSGFKAFEDESLEPVKLSSFYCKALTRTLLAYRTSSF